MEDEMERILEEMDKYNLTDHATINKQKNVILSQLLEKEHERRAYRKLLVDYRYVDEIDEFRIGSYVRYVNISKLEKDKSFSLFRGGFIVDLQTREEKVYLLCKNGGNKFFKILLQDSIVFQKNTKQEKLLLDILDHLQD
jgi:hypothetical protein